MHILASSLTISPHTPLLRNKEGRSVVTSRPVDKSAGDWGEASSTGLARFGDWREYMHGLSVAAIELSLKM